MACVCPFMHVDVDAEPREASCNLWLSWIDNKACVLPLNKKVEILLFKQLSSMSFLSSRAPESTDKWA